MRSWITRAAAVLIFALVAINVASFIRNRFHFRDRLAGFPRVLIWAWERPEDLRFVDPRECGIAVLGKTIQLEGGAVSARPRLEPIRTPAGATIVAVARIEAERLRPLKMGAEQSAAVVSEIARLAAVPGVAAVQIDFDAARAERAFYETVLKEVRRRIPASTKLSITAPPSWCMSGDWVSDLPVDEAVPLLFGEGRQALTLLESGRDFEARVCRHSVGLASGAELPRAAAGRRVYLSSARPWTAESFRDALKRLE